MRVVLFGRGDTNKDDVLSADELKEFYKHDEDNYHGHEIAKHFGGEDKATAALDLDKNGTHCSSLPPDSKKYTWRAGVIDASEFLDYASPAHALAVAMDDFDLADANGDKVLDLEEYKKTHYVRHLPRLRTVSPAVQQQQHSALTLASCPAGQGARDWGSARWFHAAP